MLSARIAKIATILVTAVALGLLVFGDVWEDLQGLGGRSTLLPFLSYLVLLVLGMRVAFWFFYRQHTCSPGEHERWPTLTVIIPAYNEGPDVRSSIESVLASEYPPELLKIICVNDGSQDDTGVHINAVSEAHPDRVRVIHLAVNSGKRGAVYTGFLAPHLETWRDQQFLGAQCTNGDDHAMTNLVLSLGHDAVYQANALVATVVPSTYSQLCRMYIRWGRSATREGLRALRFAPRRAWNRGPLVGAAILFDAVMQPLTILGKTVGFGVTLWLLLVRPIWFVNAALATTVVALFYGLIFLRSERSSEVVFGFLYAWYALFLLIWVQPFATLTVRSNNWLTRR